MDHHITSVLTTLSSSPATRHTALYHVMLVLLIHGLSQASGVRIPNCNNNNKVEIFEDSLAPVTCGDITSTVDVVWRRGDGVNIGECSAVGICTSDLYNDYRLSRSPQSTESQLTLVPDYRRHAGLTVTCQDRASGSTASCTLVIKHHSVLSECHVTNNTVDWTVSGSCRVQQDFSSDNIYICTWTLNDGQQTFGGFDGSRELCSFTQALPQAGGLYTYSISVSPPATTTFSQQLTLVEPGDITTSCPHWVVSGRDLSCTCQTTNTASPPATVRWEGRDSEKLVKTNVQREDNGTQFTCHVTWGGRGYTSINYTLLVEVLEIVVVVSSSTDFTHVIIGVVAVGGIAVIAAVTVMLIRKRRCRLQQSPADLVQLPLGSSQIVTALQADDSRPANDHNYTNLCITEVSATAQPQGAIEGKDETDMYEDTQTLTDRTYDTTCRQHEEHTYYDLQVMTSQGHSEVKATAPDPRDGEGRNKDMYYNVS